MTPPTTPHNAYTASRLIAASLVGGVTAFALIAWVVVRDGPIGGEPAGADLFVYAWVAVAFGSLLAAVVLWRMMVAPRIDRDRDRTVDPGLHASALQAGLIICWALLEAPALLGVVVYLLYGSAFTAAGGLVLMWAGIGLTWPRREWFLGA